MAGYQQYSTVTPRFRGAFVNLFAPKKKKKETDKDKFGLTMLFEEGEDLEEIKGLATQLMTDKFGADKKKWPKGFKKPWRDQEEKEHDNDNATGETYDGFVAGRLFMNGTSNNQPEVVNEDVKPILKTSEVYSGAYYIAHITLFWYDNESKGIGVSINTVQKVDEGEVMGGTGAPAAASVFKPVKKLNTKKSSSAVMDDEDDEDPMA